MTAGTIMQACPLPADLDEAVSGLLVFASLIKEVFTAAASGAALATQTHMCTSLSTGRGPVSYVQLSEGGFQVVYPRRLWSWFSGVLLIKVLYEYG